MRDLYARWAAPAASSEDVTGVQGVTTAANSSNSAAARRSAPETPDPPEGVQGVTGLAEIGVPLHLCTPSSPDGVTVRHPSEAPEIPRSVEAVTPRTPVTLANDDLMEEFEERAAIMEYEGGLSRAEAETAAARALRITTRQT